MIYALGAILGIVVVFGVLIVWLSGSRSAIPTMVRPWDGRRE